MWIEWVLVFQALVTTKWSLVKMSGKYCAHFFSVLAGRTREHPQLKGTYIVEAKNSFAAQLCLKKSCYLSQPPGIGLIENKCFLTCALDVCQVFGFSLPSHKYHIFNTYTSQLNYLRHNLSYVFHYYHFMLNYNSKIS